MDRDNRLGATMFVWGACTIITVATITALALSDAQIDIWWGILLLIFFGVLLNGVFHATEVIWGSESSKAAGKAKRIQNSRVQRLVESLEDDEIYELEALLLARDDDQKPQQDSR